MWDGERCIYCAHYAARLGGFKEHRMKYGSEAYFKRLEEEKLQQE